MDKKRMFFSLVIVALLAMPFVLGLPDAIERPFKIIWEIHQRDYIVYGLTFIFFIVAVYGAVSGALARVKVFEGEGGMPNKAGKMVALSLAFLGTISLFYFTREKGVVGTLEELLGHFNLFLAIALAMVVFGIVYFSFKGKDDKRDWKIAMAAAGFTLVLIGTIIHRPDITSTGWLLLIIAVIMFLVSAVGEWSGGGGGAGAGGAGGGAPGRSWWNRRTPEERAADKKAKEEARREAKARREKPGKAEGVYVQYVPESDAESAEITARPREETPEEIPLPNDDAGGGEQPQPTPVRPQPVNPPPEPVPTPQITVTGVNPASAPQDAGRITITVTGENLDRIAGFEFPFERAGEQNLHLVGNPVNRTADSFQIDVDVTNDHDNNPTNPGRYHIRVQDATGNATRFDNVFTIEPPAGGGAP